MPRSLHKWMPLLMLFAVICGTPLLANGIDGKDVHTWMIIPFAGVLISIAVLPLVAKHFWEHHFGKVAAAWIVVTLLILLLASGGKWDSGAVLYEVAHVMLLDYVPFIILLLGLFTIAGGIRVKGTLRGSPMVNTVMLLIGTVLASWMGTTGAAMLMIRPVLRANAWRERKAHVVVFFIFLVCNVGGSLTPLGDPPLFLGFLRGVPFDWTFRILPETGLIALVLLVAFFVFDAVMLGKEKSKTPPAEPGEGHEKFGIEGGVNFLLLAGLIGAILLSSSLDQGAFKNTEGEAKYTAALEAADGKFEGGKKTALGMTDHLKSAVQKDDPADPKKINKLARDFGAAEDLTAALASYDLAKKQAVLVHEKVPKHGEEHAADDKLHVQSADDPLAVNEKDMSESGLDKKYGGGIDGRIAALNDLKAGTLAKDKAEAVRHLCMRDYQRSVLWTNDLRSHQGHDATMGIHAGPLTIPYTNLVRDAIILLLVLISLAVTKKESRVKNGFSWGPILEVAKLFSAIFICMIPALRVLAAGVNGEMAGVVDAVTYPNGEPVNAMYFWFSGALSSFLDNAPTYLVFFNTAGGDAAYLTTLGAETLIAISMGAVFMGANTYIGNAPNFMVKSIAEENHVKMPSFFGYMVWSICILIPLFVLVTFLKFIWHVL
jgi:Na+/H+ antiporter NhaD/arsenite permease-like protein